MGDNLLAIYTNALSIPKGKGIGVGITVYNYIDEAKEIHTKTLNLGYNQIVYNRELEGITQGFEYTANNAILGQEIYIFANNQAAIFRLQTPSDNPGQEWLIRCIKATEVINSKGAIVTIQWVLGHTDTPGNERADQLAKRAAKQNLGTTKTSLALTSIKVKGLAIPK
jgi:ribonuclease HI